VKPGNLRRAQGAKSGGETKDEACKETYGAPRNRGAFFNVKSGVKECLRHDYIQLRSQACLSSPEKDISQNLDPSAKRTPYLHFSLFTF